MKGSAKFEGVLDGFFEARLAANPTLAAYAGLKSGEGKLGTFWDQLRLNCLTFDPRTNSYSLAAMTLMRIAGVVTVVVIAVMIFVMLRKERRRPTPAIA